MHLENHDRVLLWLLTFCLAVIIGWHVGNLLRCWLSRPAMAAATEVSRNSPPRDTRIYVVTRIFRDGKGRRHIIDLELIDDEQDIVHVLETTWTDGPCAGVTTSMQRLQDLVHTTGGTMERWYEERRPPPAPTGGQHLTAYLEKDTPLQRPD